MFSKIEREEILKKMESMSDKDKEELYESIREAFNKPVEIPSIFKTHLCQCCYCRNRRGFG